MTDLAIGDVLPVGTGDARRRRPTAAGTADRMLAETLFDRLREDEDSRVNFVCTLAVPP